MNKRCKECGAAAQENANFCPMCGGTVFLSDTPQQSMEMNNENSAHPISREEYINQHANPALIKSIKNVAIVLLIVLALPFSQAKKLEAKSKYTHYDTMLNMEGYVDCYSEYKKNKWGIAYDVYVKKNKLKISGALTKGSKPFGNDKKRKFLGEKTRTFQLTQKTVYRIESGEDSLKISKSKFSGFMKKGSKGLLAFGINLKVKSGKVVTAIIYS